jgi:hypothetical protein
MPWPSAILAATIGVTFVGPKNLLEKTCHLFCKVNRLCVCMALEWLKQNNPLYRDIIISSDRLDDLPVDGIPLEIMSVTRCSDNTSLLATEDDGYVPEDIGEVEGTYNTQIIDCELTKIYGAPDLNTATLGQRPNWLRNFF